MIFFLKSINAFYSCKTVRRWQRSILLVNGGHCVGDRGEMSVFSLSGRTLGSLLALGSFSHSNGPDNA